MSELTQEFVVTDLNANIVVDTNDITISPNTVQLSIYTGSSPVSGGTTGQLQYNNGGALGGVANTSYSPGTGNLTLGNLSNIKITGGANAYFLQTDGTGNLVWAQGTANVSGNGTAAGANTQIQISDGTGNFTSAAGFTFDAASNILSAPGNGSFGGNVSASYFIGNGAFLTGLDTSTISNGNSNVKVYSNSNVTVSANGVANVAVFTDTELTVNDLRTNNNKVHIGYLAGTTGQGDRAIAIGNSAGYNAQGTYAIAIGPRAGNSDQGQYAIAIGEATGAAFQGQGAVAIGQLAGLNSQGANSIAIGLNAAPTSQHANSIVLNATGANLDTDGTDRFFVKPIRNANTANILFYNNTTGEISYSSYGVVSPSQIANGTSNVDIATANGNITATVNGTTSLTITNGNVIARQFVSNVATGTAPLQITSTTRVSNLNVAQAGVSDTANINGSPANALHYLTFANSAATGNRQLFTSSTLTYNPSLGNLTVPTALNATLLSGTITVGSASQPNITTVGNLTTLSVAGNMFCNVGTFQANNINVVNNLNSSKANVANIYNTSGIILANSVTANVLVNNNFYVFANVPNATFTPGGRVIISDANTTTFNAVVGGGGSNIIPIFSDGTQWKVG